MVPALEDRMPKPKSKRWQVVCKVCNEAKDLREFLKPSDGRYTCLQCYEKSKLKQPNRLGREICSKCGKEKYQDGRRVCTDCVVDERFGVVRAQFDAADHIRAHGLGVQI